MKQFLIPLILFLIINFNSTAQIEKLKADDIAKIKARQMIMVLREEDPELTARYKKDHKKLALYRKEIENYNERIQKVAPKFWKFNAVLFKSASEVTALRKSKNKEYAIAEFELKKVKEKPTLSSLPDPFKDDMVVPNLSVHLIEKPAAILGAFQFMERSPTEAELAVALMQMQAAYITLENGITPQNLREQNAETLKTKILVLDQFQFKAWISDHDIKKIYPYSYQKADKATIEQLILEQNPKYVILSIAPVVDEPMLMHSVVDLETGNTLSSVVPGAEGTGINARDSTYITKESLFGYANGVGP